jgi:catechol 2,3-dioxygenase-like lactoylglutathione lyase family enzyme
VKITKQVPIPLTISSSWLKNFALVAKGLVLLVLASAGISRGQSVDLSGIAHAAFRVSDVAKTSLFYQKLGFDQAFVFSSDGKISQAFIKINDRQFIELYPLTPKDSQIGFMHLCFEGQNLIDLNAAYRQRGLNPTEVKKAHAGNLLFTLVGPEHQNIEYTQYLPGSLHWNDRSKHLGKHRISKQLLAVNLAMQDPTAAETFYLDSLSFHPRASNDKSYLLLPGASGEAVEFSPGDDKTAPDIVLQVQSVPRAARMLRDRGFSVRVDRDGVFVNDPDGIPIEFSAAQQLKDEIQ